MKLVIDCLIFEHKKAPGYEHYIINILNYISQNRKKVLYDEVIVAIRESQIDQFQKYSKIFTIKTFRVCNIIDQIYFQNMLKFYLKLKQNDLILFTCGYASIWKQCKSILVVHDLLHLHYPQYFDILRRIQRAILVPISLRKTNKVIAISNFTKNDIIKNFHIANEKINVIYNDCNFDKFMAKNEHDKSGDFELYNNRKYFLSVSSLAPHKNIKLLIKVFLEIASKDDSCDLVLVGSSSNLDNVSKELIEKTSLRHRVIFTDYISNYKLGQLYQKCLAFILPTQFEGFGMPIAEALFFNAVTILSDIEICREIAGDNALYFDDEDQLNLYMKKMITIGITPKITSELVKNKYSENNTSGKYIDLINNIRNT
jgi:glycosyltransferase involved in cell wall biosynthesis